MYSNAHRDAPEPTGEEGEEADMELPKVYEPVYNMKELRERLEMFLSQFNEMVRGAGMDLVFFPDAMLHLIKVNHNYCTHLVYLRVKSVKRKIMILEDIESDQTPSGKCYAHWSWWFRETIAHQAGIVHRRL